MDLNTDINILSNLPDLSILSYFLDGKNVNSISKNEYHGFGDIKTVKSLKRFDKAINKSLINCEINEVKTLINSIYSNESISNDFFLLLFWNLSYNNDFFQYLNNNVYFPDLYSGRITIKSSEVQGCIKELQTMSKMIESWTPITVRKISSAYLRLLTKLNLLEGGLNKTFKNIYLSDKMFVLFIYWILAIETKPNLIESQWMKYAFCEQDVFLERVRQKKFSKFFQLSYTGDKLKIEPSIPYNKIYEALK